MPTKFAADPADSHGAAGGTPEKNPDAAAGRGKPPDKPRFFLATPNSATAAQVLHIFLEIFSNAIRE